MVSKKHRICEIPNSGIIEALKLVEEMAYKGYKCNLDHRSLFLALGPSLLDIELVFTKETPKEEIKETIEKHEEFIDALDKTEEEIDFNTGSKYDEENVKIETEVVTKDEILYELERAVKHAELKEVANKYNLEVRSNLRNPQALRKDLIKQLESQ